MHHGVTVFKTLEKMGQATPEDCLICGKEHVRVGWPSLSQQWGWGSHSPAVGTLTDPQTPGSSGQWTHSLESSYVQHEWVTLNQYASTILTAQSCVKKHHAGQWGDPFSRPASWNRALTTGPRQPRGVRSGVSWGIRSTPPWGRGLKSSLKRRNGGQGPCKSWSGMAMPSLDDSASPGWSQAPGEDLEKCAQGLQKRYPEVRVGVGCLPGSKWYCVGCCIVYLEALEGSYVASHTVDLELKILQPFTLQWSVRVK